MSTDLDLEQRGRSVAGQGPREQLMAVGARQGRPLRVIEEAADDPCLQQPEAFLGALRAALGTS